MVGVWAKVAPRLLSVGSTLPTPAIAPLVDADWRFGVTVSTDDLAKVGTVYVQLKLVVDDGGSALRAEVMELSLSAFYGLLAQLERSKSFVDYLSGAGVGGAAATATAAAAAVAGSAAT